MIKTEFILGKISRYNDRMKRKRFQKLLETEKADGSRNRGISSKGDG
jgi:hypothetical protein